MPDKEIPASGTETRVSYSEPARLTPEATDGTHAGHEQKRASEADPHGRAQTRAPAMLPEAMGDDVLISLFQGGDRSVFRLLVERHRERIRNLVFSVMNDPGLVDDLSQEVFIKAYEGLPNFRFESSFYTWVYRIAVNRCRDEMRKRKFRRFFSLHQLMDSRDKELTRRTSVEMEDTETQELIAASLQTLPDKYRIPVVLKDIDGRSYEEIAEIMNCELGTVKSRLSRARAILRKKLLPLLDR